MRVGLDLQLAVGTSTGIGEFAAGLFSALTDRDDLRAVALRAPWLDPWRFDRRVLWDQVLLPMQARRARVDVLHCTAGTMPLLPGAHAAVATVHDVAWLRVQSHVRAYARAYFGAFTSKRYHALRAIAVDSNFSRDELLELVPGLDPSRVHVIYCGVDPRYAALERRPDAEPFVLAPGTVEPRKNLLRVIEALPAVPGLRLVSVGPATPYRERCEARARELGLGERVEFRGYVSRDEVFDLYARATAVASASTYEGFGYAAAQALCAGVPLIASNAASLPEIVGDAWPLSSPHATEPWQAALRTIARDRAAAETHAASLRLHASERFGWDAISRAYVELYRSVASG